MKQFVTMLKMAEFHMYQKLEPMDYRFLALTQLFSCYAPRENIIEWLDNEKDTLYCGNYVDVSKEQGTIALYETSGQRDCEADNYVDYDPTKRFQMSVKNFAEIMYQWEELRASRPDIILVVIHEDNHVSLETDPIIIKKYQDAGYAFDYKKHQPKITEYVCYEKDFYEYLNPTGVRSYHCYFNNIVDVIQKKYFPNRENLWSWSLYQYHNTTTDDFFIGSYFSNPDGTLQPAEHELATYVNAENSRQISRHNFLEFEQQWLELENNNTIFAVVYRNEQGWICCQPFETSDEMYAFVMQIVELDE